MSYGGIPNSDCGGGELVARLAHAEREVQDIKNWLAFRAGMRDPVALQWYNETYQNKEKTL